MSLSFSIVICTHNSLPQLEDTLGSVLMQDSANIELVFVDSGSTDGTLELIHTLQCPHRLLKNVRGGGACAMNAGIHAATGEIIAFLPPGAYYLSPDILDSVARHLASQRQGWLFARALREINGRLQDLDPVPKYSYAQLLRHNFIALPAAFIRRELIRRIGGFDSGLRYAMAYDLWLKVACLSEPIALDVPVIAQCEDEGSYFTRIKLATMNEELCVSLAHTGDSRLSRAVHHARHFLKHRQAIQSGTGENGIPLLNSLALFTTQHWHRRMRSWLAD